MPYWLIKWFSPPKFPDDSEETARARIINVVQIFLLVVLIAAFVLLPNVVTQRPAYSVVIILMLFFLAIGRVAMFRGQLKNASLLVSAVGWTFFTVISMVKSENTGPLVFAIMGTVIVMGLLVDRRTSILFLFISVFGGLLVAILQETGVVLPQPYDIPPLVSWSMFALAMFYLHGLMLIVLSDLKTAVANERQKNAALKGAEITLLESEQRFRMLAENALSGVYIVQHGHLVYANRSLEEIFGYSHDEMIGLSASMLIHPDERAEVLSQFQRRINGEIPSLRNEIRGMRKNGETVHIEILGSRVELSGSAALIGNIFDITERKQAEMQMELLKYSIDTAFDCAYWMDIEGRFLYVNDAACKSLGYLREELLGMQIFDINPEVNPGCWPQTLEELKHKGTINIESLHRRKDGSEYPVEVSSMYFQFGDREFVSGVAKDITERKLAEERIQLSEKKYHELFQVNKDGISIFPFDEQHQFGKFVEANTAAHKMLGYTMAEFLEQTPVSVEGDVSEEQMRFRQLELETRGTVDFDAILRNIDGYPVYTEITAQLIQYEGRPAIMNIVRDVTERKQHEIELHAIATLSAALRTARTRMEMLPVIGEQIMRLLNSDAVTIEIIDAQTGDAVIEAAYGIWSSMAGLRQKKGTGLNAIITQTLRPYLTNNMQEGQDMPNPVWASDGICGSAGLPLIAQEKLIGFLWIGHKNELAETQIRLFSAITDIAANAIHRTSMHEQAVSAAHDLSTAYDTTLEAWARALELRDQETQEHSLRVREMTLRLARLLGFDETQLVHVRRGAILHDIGKIGIPDRILRKEGALDANEWVIMRTHPKTAYDLLEPIEHLHPALDIPYCHHEKWDGSGYPRGLQGEQIPLSARLFAVVDVWDALRSDRPYRAKWSVEDTCKHIRAQAGLQFDPEIVDLFLGLVHEIEPDARIL